MCEKTTGETRSGSVTGEHPNQTTLEPAGLNLSKVQAAALLTADCVGVGILALPKDVQELGWISGLGFLILNLPINLYAGTILSDAALDIEKNQAVFRDEDESEDGKGMAVSSDIGCRESEAENESGNELAVDDHDNKVIDRNPVENEAHAIIADRKLEKDGIMRRKDRTPYYGVVNGSDVVEATSQHHGNNERKWRSGDDNTFDLIGMTDAIFQQGCVTRLVVVFYYTNLFLILGDYILVMSHAVQALFYKESICLPTAGVIASVLMFAVSQFRTMAMLGREASTISLLAMFVVLVQCLVASSSDNDDASAVHSSPAVDEDDRVLRKFSALGSIGFAVGSQKLFLNIRHDMEKREQAPMVLGLSLAAYGMAYVVVIVLAGPDPPSFLFDSIPQGLGRRFAGFLLWIHVAVSYAINCQAICSSIDRLCFCRIQWFQLHDSPRYRWALLTLGMAVLSYLVANAIPFFQDLLSLIGALTTVPLTLSLPVLLHRRIRDLPVLYPGRPAKSCSSYSLLLYSIAFLFIGVLGAVYSIKTDWSNHGAPFSCN